MNDLRYDIALTKVPLVGPVTARTLLHHCGGAREIFSTSPRELVKIAGIGPAIAAAIHAPQPMREAEAELALAEAHGVQVLVYPNPPYPYRLLACPDAPTVLYYRGSADLNSQRIVSVVGTRQPTAHGQRATEQLLKGLAAYNVLIVSGLAYGVDACAHRYCLETGIPTLGVLAHGLGTVYPSEHTSLAEKMVRQGGLLSEFGWQVLPEREHFPMRNRIVAALSDAVVVVETANRGGSLITAQLANDYNRDVFAFPGRSTDKSSAGCNWLIKTHRAALIEDAEDLSLQMGWQQAESKLKKQISLFENELSPEEEIILTLLRGRDAVHLDQLMAGSGFKAGQLAVVLLELECKSVIAALPGKCYSLLG
jgi:DNA processing protein